MVGTALLGGSLDVLLTGGFTPVLGNTFEIVTAGIVLDTFTSVNLPTIGNLGWAINYNPTNVLLEVVVPIPGDFDVDFDVDGADFLAIQRSDPSLIPTWEANFGQLANASPTSSAVPEPGAMATLV